MPASVPTPGPSQPAFSEPPLPDLPNALLAAGGRRVEGVVGCGMSWWLDGSFSGGDSGATTWAEPGDDRVLEVGAGDTLRFDAADGVVFEEWTLLRATQADSDYWNGLAPPLEEIASGQDDTSIEFAAPPTGEWVLLLDWDGSDDRWGLQDVRDHFRVIVR